MFNKICCVCGEKKVWITAYWFGLKHCHKCDLKILRQKIRQELLEEWGHIPGNIQVINRRFPKENFT